ncbi:hypothetical protein R1sor_025700 [Riccia sorocarpa]|uniref:Uncharacterized protein n=1 Tax=Riccia sorocarpa TaxID=122646 RepID=A0ABD3G9C3_9MARC
METICEAQKKKEDSGHVFVHHLGAGGRRLFKEDFLSKYGRQPATDEMGMVFKLGKAAVYEPVRRDN